MKEHVALAILAALVSSNGKLSVQKSAEARIRIWRDGEKEPSVNCPLGMIFGFGWGEIGTLE